MDRRASGVASPITDVHEIAHIAYGFKASKALLTAIDLEIFRFLSPGSSAAAELSERTGIPVNRMEALLAALCGLGLVIAKEGRYSNAPACEEYLVPGRKSYLGDYFRLQTDRLIFPAFAHLTELLQRGRTPAAWRRYDELMRDPREAEQFSRGQHHGSLGPAIALAKKLDLSGRRALLDVGGGSGAFTIALCKRNPALRATLLDYEGALGVARGYVAEAKLSDRVGYLPGNALQIRWPADHDTILMSYLLSAVDGECIDPLIESAFSALPAGGMLVVHDFMADDDKCGPPDAALWFLTCLFNAPSANVLTPGGLERRFREAGFAGVSVWELIPGLTRVAQAHKPG